MNEWLYIVLTLKTQVGERTVKYIKMHIFLNGVFFYKLYKKKHRLENYKFIKIKKPLIQFIKI